MRLLDIKIGEVITNKTPKYLDYYKLENVVGEYYLFVGYTHCETSNPKYDKLWAHISEDEICTGPFDGYSITNDIPQKIAIHLKPELCGL